MTKSTITDKRVTSVIERLEHYACNLKWTNVRGAQDLLTAADGLRELQERRKPLQDKDLQGVIDALEHPAGINTAGKQVVRLAMVELQERRKADSEPVAWTWHYREQWHVTNDERRAEFVAKDGDVAVLPLYRHAQPAPVVPDDVLDALQKVARIRLDLNDFDGDRRGIADCLGDAEEALIEVVNRRAAMLAAAPQSPGSEPATVPGKWIPVSERMPEREVDVQVYCPDKKEQMVAYLERNELEGYFRFATWSTGEGIYCHPTHWMQLPAGPREVKGE